MYANFGKVLSFVSLLLVLLISAPTAGADDPTGLRPPTVKPSSERTVGIPPWEMASTSPWGGMRSGGSDQRRFVFSPDGKSLATEDGGGWQIELWDVQTGKSHGRFGRIEFDPIALAFTPDSKQLVTAATGSKDLFPVELWDVATHKRLRFLDEEVNLTPFTAIAVSPDGQTLVLGAGRGRRSPGKLGIHFWDLASGDEVRRIDGPEPSSDPDAQRWHPRLYDALCFTPDSRALFLVADNRVWLWEVASGKPRGLLSVLPSAYTQKSRGEQPAPLCAVVSPDGRTAAVGCLDGAVRFFDLRRGQPIPPLVAHTGRVRAVTFSADGSSLVTLGSDNVLRTWPLAQALRTWAPTSERLAPAVLESLWKDLLDGDPVYGYAAVRNLAARPEQALPLLRERVKPVPAIDSERVKELVKILTQDDFNARKRAAAELRKFADLALPVLRAVNQRGGYNEMLMRMQDRLEADYPTLDQLRTLRALEVLELIGTAEAKKLLDDLAGGAAESLLTQRAKAIRAGLDKAAAPVNLVVPSDDLWTALADVDAARAFAAIRTLWAAPDKAVPFLRERLKGVAALTAFDDDPERIAKLITDLDSDDFAVREQATKSLAALGKAAEAALQKALAGNPSIEARKRIEILLKDVDRAALTPERLRAARCLEVLEGLGDEAARPVLAALAQEAKSRWLKDAAADSLRRLRK